MCTMTKMETSINFKKLETMKYEIMTTNDGYMIFDLDNDDYIYDSKGDNLWDTIDEVNNVLTNLKNKKNESN